MLVGRRMAGNSNMQEYFALPCTLSKFEEFQVELRGGCEIKCNDKDNTSVISFSSHVAHYHNHALCRTNNTAAKKVYRARLKGGPKVA